VIASGGMTTRGTDVIGLVASIADRDIAIGGVLSPNPQMDLSQAPSAIRKLIAATGWTP
jgi:hypothetical protein